VYGISRIDLIRAQRAADVLYHRLKRHPDIAGYGVGCRRTGGCIKREACIILQVRKKRAPQLLRQRALPRQFLGIPIDVADDDHAALASPCPGPLVTNIPFDPVAPGVCIGNSLLSGEVGSLGLVAHHPSGTMFFLSNCHVLFGSGTLQGNPSGAFPVEQPVATDGSRQIGQTAFGVINPLVDCAVGQFLPTVNVTALPVGLNAPVTGRTMGAPNMPVVKSGATGIARGRISHQLTSGSVRMPDGRIRPVQNQWVVVAAPGQPFPMSEGDSGSLWIEVSTGRMVALVIGGVPGQSSLANRMELVAAAVNKQVPGLIP
jgi:hypothetical protein